MSYTKQTWTSGEVITANKLNHIEDGIEENNVLYVNVTYTPNESAISIDSSDKTYAEISSAYTNGKIIMLVAKDTTGTTYERVPLSVFADGTGHGLSNFIFDFPTIPISYPVSPTKNMVGVSQKEFIVYENDSWNGSYKFFTIETDA